MHDEIEFIFLQMQNMILIIIVDLQLQGCKIVSGLNINQERKMYNHNVKC